MYILLLFYILTLQISSATASLCLYHPSASVLHPHSAYLFHMLRSTASLCISLSHAPFNSLTLHNSFTCSVQQPHSAYLFHMLRSTASLCISLSHAPFNSLTLHISSTVLTVPVWRTNWLLFLLILRPLACFCALPYTLQN